MFGPRSLLAKVAFDTGLWRTWRSGAFILFYHGITETIRDRWLEADFLPFRIFREHLDFFQKRRVVVPLAEFLDCLSNGRSPDPRLVAICFDDALAILAQRAIPELVARNLPFTVGIPTGLPGTGRSIWELEAAFLVHVIKDGPRLRVLAKLIRELSAADAVRVNQSATSEVRGRTNAQAALDDTKAGQVSQALKRFLRAHAGCCSRISTLDRLIAELHDGLIDELKEDGRFSIMNWEELQNVCSAGGSPAAHGHLHHPHNAAMHDACRRDEFRLPREAIKRHLGRETDDFVWPEGKSDPTSIEIGRALGYKYFLSTKAGLVTNNTPHLEIPRISGQWSLPQVLWHAANS